MSSSLAVVVSASDAVGATTSRLAKRALIAAALTGVDPDELPIAIAYLAGSPRQDTLGVAWAGVADVDAAPADEPHLSLADVDATFARLAAESGPGSVGRRSALLDDLLSRATRAEQSFLRRLIMRDLRQGATDGVMVDAIATAAEVPAKTVRRAAMLMGSVVEAGVVALTAGRSALEDIGLTVGVPVQPMLAKTASDVTAALETFGEASVETKLDGARVQVHRNDGAVRIYSRNLRDITARLPEVSAAVLSLPHDRLILDGEMLAIDDSGRPLPFQSSMSRFGTTDEVADSQPSQIRAFFFDVLHVDGTDLIDEPATHRWDRLAELPAAMLVDRIVTSDPAVAEDFASAVLANGHEGVMVKDPHSVYAAGRRGATWLKIKPAHTFDLVVLAVEWGSGRRQGLLSNIHLGVRGTDGGFVMVGKTFKGMTDETLAWQTERFLELETSRSGRVVHVRPEQVVEIAIDGIQRSTRYPGGVALRFARVKGYRMDKSAAEADTIDDLRDHFS